MIEMQPMSTNKTHFFVVFATTIGTSISQATANSHINICTTAFEKSLIRFPKHCYLINIPPIHFFKIA